MMAAQPFLFVTAQLPRITQQQIAASIQGLTFESVFPVMVIIYQ